MSTVSPVGLPNTAGTSSATNPASALGKDDFLKLLVGQLRSQNPLIPSSDQDYIAQMAQFSMVEQVANMASSNEKLLKTLKIDQAFGLIGKTVNYKKPDGSSAEGIVEKVTVDGDLPTLTVGGTPGIDPTKVTEVK